MPATTTCPDLGALRAALDGERPDLHAHVDGCELCTARSAELSRDAGWIAALLAGGPGPVDVERALGRHSAREAVSSSGPVAAPAPARRRLPHLTRIAAALTALVAIGGFVTPTGRAAADALLSTFRAESLQVVPVDVSTLDPRALEGLIELAEVEGLEDLVEPRVVADLGEASEVAGLLPEALDVDALPASLRTPAGDHPVDPVMEPSLEPGEVEIVASAPQQVRISFSDQPGIPAELVGTTLVLDLPGVVLQTVGGDTDIPAFVRGEAGLLGVSVEGGSSLAEVRDALLDVPGLPPETVAALRGIEDWETTLPLPVPVGSVAFESTTVDGRPGVSFGDDTGLGAALLWRTDDRFVGVGGFLPLSDVRRIAEGT